MKLSKICGPPDWSEALALGLVVLCALTGSYRPLTGTVFLLLLRRVTFYGAETATDDDARRFWAFAFYVPAVAVMALLVATASK